jgi:hypothetical protein
MGTGDTVLASAVGMNSFETLVTVYEGTCDALFCTEIDTESSDARWDTADGTVYHILIHSRGQSVGDFVLSLGTTLNGDVCNDAEDLEGIPDSGLLLSGTTEGMNFYNSLDICYDHTTSPAKIYFFTSSSRQMVSVSADSFNLDVRVSVNKGTCGGDLECAGNHDWRSTHFESEVDASYFIFVHGSQPRDSGDSFLRIDSMESGDVCKHSVPLDIIPEDGLMVIGSTEDGHIYSNFTNCGEDMGTSPAVIYSVVGTGGLFSASVTDSFWGRRLVSTDLCLQWNLQLSAMLQRQLWLRSNNLAKRVELNILVGGSQLLRLRVDG